MAEVAVAVDARGATAFVDVAGVPAAIRLARRAVRDGHSVTLHVVDEEAARRALSRRPVARTTVVVGAPPAGAEVADAGDVPAAERQLFAALRKSIELDGFVAYHLLRPLARPLTRAVLPTQITPNQVTLFALGLGLVAAFAASRGAFAIAGLLYWAGSIVDCVDGEVARLRLEGSRTGEWLDSVADEVSTFALVAGVGWGLGGVWAVLAVLCLATGGPAITKLYVDLARLGLPIDTARYPWFFLDPSAQGLEARPGTLGRLVYIGSFFFKRDAYTTLVSFALLTGVPRVAFLLLTGGIGVITVLLFVHLTIGSHERDDPPR